MCKYFFFFRINLRLGKIWMILYKINKFRLFVDDFNSIIVDIINIVLMGEKFNIYIN